MGNQQPHHRERTRLSTDSPSFEDDFTLDTINSCFVFKEEMVHYLWKFYDRDHDDILSVSDMKLFLLELIQTIHDVCLKSELQRLSKLSSTLHPSEDINNNNNNSSPQQHQQQFLQLPSSNLTISSTSSSPVTISDVSSEVNNNNQVNNNNSNTTTTIKEKKRGFSIFGFGKKKKSTSNRVSVDSIKPTTVNTMTINTTNNNTTNNNNNTTINSRFDMENLDKSLKRRSIAFSPSGSQSIPVSFYTSSYASKETKECKQKWNEFAQKVQQQIDTMIKDIDKNQDGQIQFEEFLQFLKNFNLMELIQNSYPKEDKVDLQLEREFIQQQRKSISTNNNTSTTNNNTINMNTTNHNNNDNNLNENNNLNDEMIEMMETELLIDSAILNIQQNKRASIIFEKSSTTNSILSNNTSGINNNNFTITLNNDIAIVKDNNKKDLYNIVTYESPQELNDYLQQQLLNKEENKDTNNKENKDLENNNTNKENTELMNELEMIKSIKKAIIDNHPLKTYLLFHYCLQNDNFLQKILQQLQQQTNLKENVILQALLQCLTITLSSTSFIEFNEIENFLIILKILISTKIFKNFVQKSEILKLFLQQNDGLQMYEEEVLNILENYEEKSLEEIYEEYLDQLSV